MDGVVPPEPDPPVVLMTGATGFLGGAVAYEILHNSPDATVLFLSRGHDDEDALARVRSNLARFGAAPDVLSRVGRDSICRGGFDAFLRHPPPHAADVTHVVNCAALVSFAWNRDVWSTNVVQTEAFAQWAADLPHLRRFIHVSTALVSGAAVDRTVRESEFPGQARQFTLYTKSKAEIERRLPALLGRTLIIARPSVIVGHSRIGCQASASIFWLFRMINASRRIPFLADRRIDVVPVDHCARALTMLLFKDALSYDCYHVSAGLQASCSFEEIDAAFCRALDARLPDPLEMFDIENLSTIEPAFEKWFGPCDNARTAAAIRVYTAFAGLNVIFDNARLRSEPFVQPPRFADYLHACVQSTRLRTIAEQMADDFREAPSVYPGDAAASMNERERGVDERLEIR